MPCRHPEVIRNGDVDNYITEHYWKNIEKHQADWDSATRILYSKDYYQRLTFESWFTNLEQRPLNRSLQLPYKRLIEKLKQNGWRKNDCSDNQQFDKQ